MFKFLYISHHQYLQTDKDQAPALPGKSLMQYEDKHKNRAGVGAALFRVGMAVLNVSMDIKSKKMQS